MPEHDYKFMEYEDVIRNIEDVTKSVLKCKKGDNKMGAQELKEKLGDKLNMASLIINLTNACLSAKCLMSKMHGHNFELRGKVADLSSSAMQKTTDEMRGNQNEIIAVIEEVKKEVATNAGNMTFADILDNNKSESFMVSPIKKAMRQLKKDDMRARNVVVHGLDINPSTKLSLKDRHSDLKMQAYNVLNTFQENKFSDEMTTDELVVAWDQSDKKRTRAMEDMVILGKVDESGKAPPVLVKLSSEEEVSHIMKCAKQLAKIRELRKVFISVDLGEEQRENRRALILKLKEKIRDFPSEHWIIRDGVVTSKGKYTPSQSKHVIDSEEETDLKSYKYEL